MRTNGSIRFQIDSVEYENEYGEIVVGEMEWSNPISCFIQTNSDNLKGKYEDGEFRMASFTILVEQSVLSEIEADRVKLSRNGRELGEYSIQSFDSHYYLGRVKIVV